MADYYELLGVSRSASPDELKRAYRQRARELHPDANPNDSAAAERFKEVSRAYQVLSDPDQRARYDRFGESGVGSSNGGPNADDIFSGGLNDLFSSLFGNTGGFGGGRRGPSGPPRGQDMEVSARISFEQAVFGSTVPVALKLPQRCPDCDGSGAGAGTQPVTCVECSGRGQVQRVRQSLLGQMVTTSACPRCGGLGQVVVTPCPTCRGEGRITLDHTYQVDVPAGVDNGATLRLALVTAVPVSVAQAALGTTVALPTLDGDEELLVPAGTQPGRVFVLKGRGVPRLQGRGRGDLRAEVVVEVPTKLSDAEENLLRQLAELRGESVGTPHDKGLFSRIKSAFQ